MTEADDLKANTPHKAQTWRPSWWQEEPMRNSWERVKAALLRDWEQTLHDLHAGGQALRQDAGDTIKQALGTEALPADEKPDGTRWHFTPAELPLVYGCGARVRYQEQHRAWDDDLEAKLRMEWEGGALGTDWDEVRTRVKFGFEYR